MAKVKSYTPLQWIKALKNAEKYQHRQDSLGDEIKPGVFGACCLGVAAVEMGVAKVSENGAICVAGSKRDADSEGQDDGTWGNYTSLPNHARPPWLSKVNQTKLIEINDDRNTSDYILQIEYIEKFLVPKWRKQKAAKK